MNPLFRAVDSLLESAAVGLKAVSTLATLPFARGGGSYYQILPRTKYDYGGDVGQGLGSSIVIAVV